jgi:hypothetical protein
MAKEKGSRDNISVIVIQFNHIKEVEKPKKDSSSSSSISSVKCTKLNNERVFVKKFLNHDKFGIGYLLSNGFIGVTYNDQTKLILDPNNYHLDYFELDDLKNEVRNKLVTNTHEYPDFLVKKFKILVHFGA